ncbi:hypothetical protein F5Y14DRAFT_435774 [Nemania sp. NC0429]|nr:hypothetical protein F5Y14DRAFT_435774 [Nemania sp. NC0429]
MKLDYNFKQHSSRRLINSGRGMSRILEKNLLGLNDLDMTMAEKALDSLNECICECASNLSAGYSQEQKLKHSDPIAHMPDEPGIALLLQTVFKIKGSEMINSHACKLSPEGEKIVADLLASVTKDLGRGSNGCRKCIGYQHSEANGDSKAHSTSKSPYVPGMPQAICIGVTKDGEIKIGTSREKWHSLQDASNIRRAARVRHIDSLKKRCRPDHDKLKQLYTVLYDYCNEIRKTNKGKMKNNKNKNKNTKNGNKNKNNKHKNEENEESPAQFARKWVDSKVKDCLKMLDGLPEGKDLIEWYQREVEAGLLKLPGKLAIFKPTGERKPPRLLCACRFRLSEYHGDANLYGCDDCAEVSWWLAWRAEVNESAGVFDPAI